MDEEEVRISLPMSREDVHDMIVIYSSETVIIDEIIESIKSSQISDIEQLTNGKLNMEEYLSILEARKLRIEALLKEVAEMLKEFPEQKPKIILGKWKLSRSIAFQLL